MKTSLEVLNTICPPQEPTCAGHCHYKEVELNGWFLILHNILQTCIIWFMHKFNMNFFNFISIFLDWRLRFEPTLQLKGWNLRAHQNETHMRTSILNIARNANKQTYWISSKWVTHFGVDSSPCYGLNIHMLVQFHMHAMFFLRVIHTVNQCMFIRRLSFLRFKGSIIGFSYLTLKPPYENLQHLMCDSFLIYKNKTKLVRWWEDLT